MKILRCRCSNPTGGKLFAINLLLTTKQYKVDNIVNFVYYGKTRLVTLSNHYLVLDRSSWKFNVQHASLGKLMDDGLKIGVMNRYIPLVNYPSLPLATPLASENH